MYYLADLSVNSKLLKKSTFVFMEEAFTISENVTQETESGMQIWRIIKDILVDVNSSQCNVLAMKLISMYVLMIVINRMIKPLKKLCQHFVVS